MINCAIRSFHKLAPLILSRSLIAARGITISSTIVFLVGDRIDPDFRSLRTGQQNPRESCFVPQSPWSLPFLFPTPNNFPFALVKHQVWQGKAFRLSFSPFFLPKPPSFLPPALFK